MHRQFDECDIIFNHHDLTPPRPIQVATITSSRVAAGTAAIAAVPDTREDVDGGSGEYYDANI